jgi:hypothetical protein
MRFASSKSRVLPALPERRYLDEFPAADRRLLSWHPMAGGDKAHSQFGRRDLRPRPVRRLQTASRSFAGAQCHRADPNVPEGSLDLATSDIGRKLSK